MKTWHVRFFNWKQDTGGVETPAAFIWPLDERWHRFKSRFRLPVTEVARLYLTWYAAQPFLPRVGVRF
jgi:hypothetical protein